MYQLNLYTEESLSQLHLEKLNELWDIFKDENPKWLSKQDCLHFKNANNMIIVLSLFEGETFEHLRKLNPRYLFSTCFYYFFYTLLNIVLN
jgi:hypothetical protein